METPDEQLIEFFIKSGADDTQSKIMARQLIKRAGQLSEQQGWTKFEALQYLMKRIVEARGA
jgi:hypothetical protein